MDNLAGPNWIGMDLWCLYEAAFLLCGEPPPSDEQFDRDFESGGMPAIVFRGLKDAIIDGKIELKGTFSKRPKHLRLKPADAVSWARSWEGAQGYSIPPELDAAFPHGTESKTEAGSQGGQPENTTTKRNRNEFEITNLLNAPERLDDWFEAISDMAEAFYKEFGSLPNEPQAWGRLSTMPPEGYSIKPGTNNGMDNLEMPGTAPLTKSAFSRRWKKYTANKSL